MEKRPPPEREREGEVAKESRGVSQVPRSVAGRARVGRPVNVLNFQNRREKPRAAEFPHTPRRTKGIPARRRHGQAPSTPVPSPLFRLALGSPGMLSAGAMRRGAPPPPLRLGSNYSRGERLWWCRSRVGARRGAGGGSSGGSHMGTMGGMRTHRDSPEQSPG